jgi:hypothetical protein
MARSSVLVPPVDAWRVALREQDGPPYRTKAAPRFSLAETRFS